MMLIKILFVFFSDETKIPTNDNDIFAAKIGHLNSKGKDK